MDLKDHLPDYSCGGDNWMIPADVDLTRQTPIDLPEEDKIEYEPKVKLTLAYNLLEKVNMMNATWTVKMMAHTGESKFGFLRMTDLNGVGPLNYVCTQFHFHSPAEHKLNGKQYDLELHFVHEFAEKEEMKVDK